MVTGQSACDAMARITQDDFQRVEMRVGTIKRSSAAVRPFYSKEELLGRQVICVLNFPPKQIADFHSDVLTLGVMEHGGRIVLLQPDRRSKPGGRIG